MRSLPILFGERVYLGNFPFNQKFYEQYYSWLHNPQVEEFIGPVAEDSPEKVKKMLLENKLDEKIKHWCVYFGDYGNSNSQNYPIGDGSLSKLSSFNEFAELDKDYNSFFNPNEFTILIGEGRGKGIGTEVTSLILNHAFSTGTDAVYLGVYTGNLGGIKVYERSGFKTICTTIDRESKKEELIMRVTSKDNR